MLVFVHIPKTAGTTLHKILSHQYPARKILIRHDSDGPTSPALLDRLRGPRAPSLVMGHLSVGLHRQVAGVRYLTCLRHPVARIRSLYHHARNDPSHYLHAPIHSGELSISEYVSSALSGELSNGMTRMLAGLPDFHDGVVDDATLAMAKENILTHFDGVVLSERFDEDILGLADRLGWPTPYYIRRKTGRYDHAKDDIPAKDRATILDRNAQDLQLYQWVADGQPRFGEPSAKPPASPDRLARFQHQNRRHGPIIYFSREIRRRILRL